MIALLFYYLDGDNWISNDFCGVFSSIDNIPLNIKNVVIYNEGLKSESKSFYSENEFDEIVNNLDVILYKSDGFYTYKTIEIDKLFDDKQ